MHTAFSRNSQRMDSNTAFSLSFNATNLNVLKSDKRTVHNEE